MFFISFLVSFVCAQLIFGKGTFFVVKQDKELIIEPKSVYRYVKDMRESIKMQGGKIIVQDINTSESQTESDFIEGILMELQLEVDLKANDIAEILSITKKFIDRQPNIVWDKSKKKLLIYSRSATQMRGIEEEARKVGLRAKLSKLDLQADA